MAIRDVFTHVWWQPYNNTYERTSEALYQYAGARDWLFRDSSKRFQVDDSVQYVNDPDEVVPTYR